MRWWRRTVLCDVCGKPFRKGQGAGVSRSVICSEECYVEAWRQFLRP